MKKKIININDYLRLMPVSFSCADTIVFFM